MTAPTHQQALDVALNVVAFSDDEVAAAAAEVTAKVLGECYGLEVWCQKHTGNHLLTPRELEQLIYGLQGALADAEGDPDSYDRERYDPSGALNAMCPLDDLRGYRDLEMYSEHIEAGVESRKNSRRVA